MKSSEYFGGEIIMDDAVRIKWGWFVAIGLVTLLLGVLAFGNLTLATSVTVLYVGIFMALAGLLQVLHAFQLRTWSGFFYSIFSGTLYGAAGIVAFQNPTLAASSLTLFLALALISTGFIRIWSSFQLKGQFGWGWILSSALMTLVAYFG